MTRVEWWLALDAPREADIRSNLARAVRVLGRLRELGVEPANTRFSRAELLLREMQPGSPIPFEDPIRLARMLEAIHDVFELYVGLFGSEDEPSPKMIERLRIAIGGADLSTSESEHPARDAQFELYTYGLLSKSGLRTKWYEPPDLAIRFQGVDIGIAVKRVWNADQAKKRLSIASEQIEASKMPGIIATNAQEYLSPLLPGTDSLAHRDAWLGDIARLRGHLPYLRDKDHVLGLLLCATKVECDHSTGGMVRCASFTYIDIIHSGPLIADLTKFWRDEAPEFAAGWHRKHELRLSVDTANQ